MPRLFVGNFDFEHRLNPAAARQLPESVQRINEELAAVWITMAEDGDLVWLPQAIERGFFEALAANGLPSIHPVTCDRDVPTSVEVYPWGWTAQIRSWITRHNWSMRAPEQTVVRAVNARTFSSQLEREFGMTLDDAACLESVEEFVTAIGHLADDCGRWVVKAEFGMAARQRILGRGRKPHEQILNWVRKRIQTDGRVFFEPWVEKIDEASIQITIPRSGEPYLLGVVPLLTGPRGEHRGNRVSIELEPDSLWSPAVETALRAAERIQELGYFGPLGIDAVQFRDRAGNIFLRPLQDINARATMGCLSLGLRRLLQPGEFGTWLHVRWPCDTPESAAKWFSRLTNSLPSANDLLHPKNPSGDPKSFRAERVHDRTSDSHDIRLVRTSPFSVGDQPTGHGTLFVIASSVALLNRVETMVFGSPL